MSAAINNQNQTFMSPPQLDEDLLRVSLVAIINMTIGMKDETSFSISLGDFLIVSLNTKS